MMVRFSIRIIRAEWSYIYKLKSAEYLLQFLSSPTSFSSSL